MSRARAPAQITGRPWAVLVSRASKESIGSLRGLAEIEICAAAGEFWLRGPTADEALERKLRSLPGAERFLVLPDRQIQPAGSRLPRGRLPKGPWYPLADWVRVELPVPCLAGRLDRRARLSIVRCDAVEEASVLVTTSELWAAYAPDAPQVRLDCWQFAVAADGRVLVRGRPLPPLAGRPWVEREGICVPAGWAWSPPVEAAVLRRVLGLESGDLALLFPDGTWECVSGAHLVRATRSAVRKSLEGQFDAR
jgi:MoxR-vWA-beta-propeller ternary system protein